MGTSTQGPIKMGSKLANRFYEPIVLLDSLYKACIHNKPLKPPDLLTDEAQSPELSFHYFVNKLGQLCDSQRGGDTVTAFVVLKFPDRILYRFASNRRKNDDLIHVQKFITDVLHILGRTEKDELQGITPHLLRKSVLFNRPRVESYVKALKKEIPSCIRTCVREDTDESKSIIEKLKELQELLCFSNNRKMDNDIFSEDCETMIKAIDRLYESEIDELIRNKTNEGRMNESECWCEFRHATGRLLSYLKAVQVLVSVRKRWPELFENFEVDYIPSSIPAQRPLRRKRNQEKLSADQIIGRMTSDPEKMETYRAHAQELQKCELDVHVRNQAGNQSFRPYVHAEVLVLESLEDENFTHPSQFFNGYKYIGCSKPTCRLCHYYFLDHASGVQVRPTHRNLYLNWRMPDAYDNQARKEKEGLLNKILVRIREDCFRTLNEKLPETKRHDSNTEPTYPIDSIPSRDLEDMESLEIRFRDLDMDYSEYEAMQNSGEMISFDGSNVSAAESHDEQDGGVQL